MILAHSDGPRPEPPARWIFLDPDYRKLLEWREALGPELPVGARVAAAAEELRRPFLEAIGALGVKHDSLAWWVSRVSERNTMESPLFLWCCHLRVALEEMGDDLCVVADSWAVLDALGDAARARGLEVRFAGPRRGRSRSEAVRRIGRFLAAGVARRQASPPVPELPRRFTLLRTWVSEGSLGVDGSFSDRYLPGLREWLESRGVEVVTLPVLFNLERPLRDAWGVMSASGVRFLPDARLLRPRDYAFAIATAARSARIDVGRVSLAGMDVTRLFDAARRLHAFDVGTLDAALSARLPQRLQGVERVIDLYENMIPEKALIAGFRSDSPETRLVGFQHTPLYPLMLCHHVTAEEATVAPLPDRIVASGELPHDVMVREGMPEDRVLKGPALRYAHLRQTQPTADSGQPTLLFVPLSLDTSASAELLWKLAAALPDVPVAIKPHPMAQMPGFREAVGADRLPPSFEWVGGSMDEWLARCGAVAAIASTTILETAAAGVPVVVVGREAALDLNPLAWSDELGRVVREPAEIRDEVLRLLDLDEAGRERYRELGRRLVEESFAPVTDEAMEAFLA